MAANRHTCCICHEPRQPVEKHHINGDPGDNAWNNLAVLCRNCHGLVTAKGNLGSSYSPGEVLQYKKLWEKSCAEADEQEIESPIEEVHETKLIEGNEHEEYPFDMQEGDELIFSIKASDCVDAVISDDEAVDRWAEGDVDEERQLPESYWHKTGVIHGEYAFIAPEEGQYVLLLVNWDEDSTEITVDVAVWEPTE